MIGKDSRFLSFKLGASLEDAMMKNMRNVHLYLMTDIMLLVERVEKKGVRRDFLYQVISVPYSHVVPMTGKAAFQVLQPQQDKSKFFFFFFFFCLFVCLF